MKYFCFISSLIYNLGRSISYSPMANGTPDVGLFSTSISHCIK